MNDAHVDSDAKSNQTTSDTVPSEVEAVRDSGQRNSVVSGITAETSVATSNHVQQEPFPFPGAYQEGGHYVAGTVSTDDTHDDVESRNQQHIVVPNAELVGSIVSASPLDPQQHASDEGDANETRCFRGRLLLVLIIALVLLLSGTTAGAVIAAVFNAQPEDPVPPPPTPSPIVTAPDPTPLPTAFPIESPTDTASPLPTTSPVESPTPLPTLSPTRTVSDPTLSLTVSPTRLPTKAPTEEPTQSPSPPPTVPGFCEASDVLFKDTFDSSNVSSQWDVMEPRQWVQNGWLHNQDPDTSHPRDAGAFVHQSDLLWQNYFVEITAQFVIGTQWEDFSILVRTDGYYRSSSGNRGSGYEINFQNWDSPKGIALIRKNGGEPQVSTNLARISKELPKSPMIIVISVVEERIRLWVDGESIFDVADDDPFFRWCWHS